MPTVTTSKGVPKGPGEKGSSGASGKPRTEVLTKDKRRTLRMMLQEKNNAASTIAIGIIVLLLLLLIGVGLIILGGVYTRSDLYIIGAIFLSGGVVFSVVFIITNCRPFLRNRAIHAQLEQDAAELEKDKQVALKPEDGYFADEYSGSRVSFY